jgi:hypothetical protein
MVCRTEHYDLKCSLVHILYVIRPTGQAVVKG